MDAITAVRPVRPTGGSLRGWSYYSSWSTCEWKAWLRYHYRPPEGEAGIQGTEPARTPRPLLVGSLFHQAIEGYYASGWDADAHRDTGAYDPEAAIDAMAAMVKERSTEWPGDLEREADLADVISLVARYHQHYGPGGKACDFPGFKLALDPYTGGPALETELAIDLGDGELFTSKFDAIFTDEHGALWGLEHKTSAASRVNALLQRAHLDGQVTGQWANLCAHFGNAYRIGGVALNVVVKDAGKGKDPFVRRFYHRDDAALDTFVAATRRKAQRIRGLLGEIEARSTRTGETPYQSALATLDTLPPSDQCYGFGKCDFYDLCLDRSLGERILAGTDFVPRRARHHPLTEGQ